MKLEITDRTCRMIEKMEEMFEYINDNLLYRTNRMSFGEFNCKWPRLRVKIITDYIKHGNKEEMVLVRIPKSEAIGLKIIKE